MHPAKVRRHTTLKLTDLPNIGTALAKSLRRLGIHTPDQLIGRDPVEMYNNLCSLSGKKVDKCVLDVFISITEFMNGSEPKVWWEYTPMRKAMEKGEK